MKSLNTFWISTVIVFDVLVPLLVLSGFPQKVFPHLSEPCSLAFSSGHLTNLSRPVIIGSGEQATTWNFDHVRDGRNYGLSDAQCEAAFPGLYKDVEFSTSRQNKAGRITPAKLDAIGRPSNMTRALIYDNEVDPWLTQPY